MLLGSDPRQLLRSNLGPSNWDGGCLLRCPISNNFKKFQFLDSNRDLLGLGSDLVSPTRVSPEIALNTGRLLLVGVAGSPI